MNEGEKKKEKERKTYRLIFLSVRYEMTSKIIQYTPWDETDFSILVEFT